MRRENAIVLTYGEPAGIGPEIAVKVWEALRAELPFAWVGGPRHLPAGTPFDIVSTRKTSPTSLISTLKQAQDMAVKRKNNGRD